MESQFDHAPDRDEQKAAPAPQRQELPEAMTLASQIGNQGVQRIAASGQLQRSPAAAGLVRGRVLARQDEEEHATEEAPEPHATEPGSENAAEPAGNENAAEAGVDAAAPAGNENAAIEEEDMAAA
jgi:hypothetical protein